MNYELDALRRRFDGHKPGLMGARHMFAVLCPLVEQPDGLHFLFEVRAAGVRQPGEVCFPGGRAESGESPIDCALRETEEELSIPRSEITIVGTPDFICNQRGFLLHPVLGVVSPAGLAALRPSPDEVAEVFTAPVAFFRDAPPDIYTYTLQPQIPSGFPYEAIGVSPDYPWSHGKVNVPVWYYQNHAVWGMTARIVQHLVSEL